MSNTIFKLIHGNDEKIFIFIFRFENASGRKMSIGAAGALAVAIQIRCWTGSTIWTGNKIQGEALRSYQFIRVINANATNTNTGMGLCAILIFHLACWSISISSPSPIKYISYEFKFPLHSNMRWMIYWDHVHKYAWGVINSQHNNNTMYTYGIINLVKLPMRYICISIDICQNLHCIFYW